MSHEDNNVVPMDGLSETLGRIWHNDFYTWTKYPCDADPVPRTWAERHREWVREAFFDDRGLSEEDCGPHFKTLPYWAREKVRKKKYVLSRVVILTRLETEAVHLRAQGFTLKAIAKRFEVSPSRIRELLKHAGWKLRERGYPDLAEHFETGSSPFASVHGAVMYLLRKRR